MHTGTAYSAFLLAAFALATGARQGWGDLPKKVWLWGLTRVGHGRPHRGLTMAFKRLTLGRDIP